MEIYKDLEIPMKKFGMPAGDTRESLFESLSCSNGFCKR
jgi:hypothetical protein